MTARRATVRIIAGRWRGRRLRFPSRPDLRPTADRRRETLFNWLADAVAGATCLDLFAGSGALGFEAASRGAARVDLVDSQRAVVDALRGSAAELGAEAVHIHACDARRFLQRAPRLRYDIVFLDPPFARPNAGARALARLADGWLAPGAHVYLETPARAEPPPLPPDWVLDRELTGGDVHARLFRVG